MNPAHRLAQFRPAGNGGAVAKGVIEDQDFVGAGMVLEGGHHLRVVDRLDAFGALKRRPVSERAAMGNHLEAADIESQAADSPGVMDRHPARIDLAAVPRYARRWLEGVVHRPDTLVAGVVEHGLDICCGDAGRLIDHGTH